MANQMGKFSPKLAELSQPCRELLSSKRQWIWDQSHEDAFAKVKEELSQPTVLALYNLEAETKVSADASSYGLGAVLLQLSDNEWKAVAYASRTLSKTKTRYAQIEKEALGVTWACVRFSKYLLGQTFSVETENTPLPSAIGVVQLYHIPCAGKATLHSGRVIPGTQREHRLTLKRARGGSRGTCSSSRHESTCYTREAEPVLGCTAEKSCVFSSGRLLQD